MTTEDKYQEALEKQKVEQFLDGLRQKSFEELLQERQIILDRIICFELYYGELNRDMNRAIKDQNWTDVILIKGKFRENADDKLELIKYDTIIAEKHRLTKFQII